ncbi:hypothetical protein Vadar_030383 [Vaccinium darrowii]|uniref:Uncharacterized protein n=1 Tax=Vaccinium darrowii TaxID=229202 RepID=A0ACB7XL72_9ERIC|nr:hypothetical protein Vadar_030383 [Vaccinium darrowii]
MEAVLPLATLIPTARTENFDVQTNDEAIDRELDLAEELRDKAHLKHASYQQEVARGYNKNVWMRPFNVDDLVLRVVVQKSKKTKFKPNYEGPFRVVAKAGHGSYKLTEMDGTPMGNPWNATKLRKFYA